MSPSTRRRTATSSSATQPRPRYLAADSDQEDSMDQYSNNHNGNQEQTNVPLEDSQEGIEDGVEDNEDEDKDDEGLNGPASTLPPPPPNNLKEISSLASWTVSSSKPGCSIAQLRSPSTSLYWQSDGPQPHYLNIHFFKKVSIVAMRIYLDFNQDESYTPTRIVFAAGTGYNDLQVFSEMHWEKPKGWVDVDFSDVGAEEWEPTDTDGNSHGDAGNANNDYDDYDGTDTDDVDEMVDVGNKPTSVTSPPKRRWRKRQLFIRRPVLHTFLVQVRILENHQNGKDTHLRGLQIFARDGNSVPDRRNVRKPKEGKSVSSSGIKKTASPDDFLGSDGMLCSWDSVPDIR